MMKSKNRQLIGLLAILTAFGLIFSACGRIERAEPGVASESEAPASTSEAITPTPEATQTPTPEATPAAPAEEPEEDPEEEEESGATDVKAVELERINNDIGEVTGDLYIYEFQETLRAKGDNAVIQDGLGHVSQRMRDLTLNYLDDYEIVAENTWTEADGNIDLNLRAGMEVDIVRADTRVISFTNRLVQSGLPEHDRTAVVGATIDPITGRELELSEVVKNMDEFARAVKDQLRKDLASDPEVNAAADQVDALLARGNLISDAELSWTMGNDGVTMYFNNGYGFPYGTETGKTRTVNVRASDHKDVYDVHFLERPDGTSAVGTDE